MFLSGDHMFGFFLKTICMCVKKYKLNGMDSYSVGSGVLVRWSRYEEMSRWKILFLQAHFPLFGSYLNSTSSQSPGCAFCGTAAERNYHQGACQYQSGWWYRGGKAHGQFNGTSASRAKDESFIPRNWRAECRRGSLYPLHYQNVTHRAGQF